MIFIIKIEINSDSYVILVDVMGNDDFKLEKCKGKTIEKNICIL